MKIPPDTLEGEKKILISKEPEYGKFCDYVSSFFKPMAINFGQKLGEGIVDAWIYEDDNIICQYTEIFHQPAALTISVTPLYMRPHGYPYDDPIDIFFYEYNYGGRLSICIPRLIRSVMDLFN